MELASVYRSGHAGYISSIVHDLSFGASLVCIGDAINIRIFYVWSTVSSVDHWRDQYLEKSSKSIDVYDLPIYVSRPLVSRILRRSYILRIQQSSRNVHCVSLRGLGAVHSIIAL